MNEQLIRQALSFALENPHSDFYRRKYGSEYARLLGVPFTEVPLLTRAEIEAVPVLERTFLPPALIRFIRTTSGSSGRGVVGMPMPEDEQLEEYLRSVGYTHAPGEKSRYFEPYFSLMNIRSMLLFSAGAFVHEMRIRVHEGRTIIAGEFSEPAQTAALAAEAGCEAVVGNPSGLIGFAPHLVHAGGSEAVRLIISVGERPTELQFTQLRAYFPNARVALQYGLAETQGPIGYSCPMHMDTDPRALHVAEGSLLVELIHPESGEVLPLMPGVEGELVVTTHEPHAFALVRYRTGDYARILEKSCSCEGNPLFFECLGRLALDRVRVPSGTLSIAAVEEAVLSLGPSIEEYTATWDVERTPPGLSIELYTNAPLSIDDAFVRNLASKISISPDRSYQDIVERGLASALAVSILPPSEYAQGWKKKRRLS